MSRYVKQGCPTDVSRARAWVTARRKQRAPKVSVYELAEVEGDVFDRLKRNELSISRQIAGLEQKVLPALEARLAAASDDNERKMIEVDLFGANQALVVLRREHRAIGKMLVDFELRRAELGKDVVHIDELHDVLQRVMFKFAQYVRVNIPLEASGNDPFLKKAYSIITGEICAQFQKAVRDLIEELKNPPLEVANEDENR